MSLEVLINELNYAQSPYYRRSEDAFEPETVHLFRTAKSVNLDLNEFSGLDGIYVFKRSPHGENDILAAQPAVFVASAATEIDARKIHQRLWNLSNAPFIIIVLPQQIRIYTGFHYSSQSKETGLLDTFEIDKIQQINTLLSSLASVAVDSGQIWASQYAAVLDLNQRVDYSLLNNLKKLGKVLEENGLTQEISHALIGKYVYFSYLRDRKILTDNWLSEQGITVGDIFSHNATIDTVQKLTEALEQRFNGRIFPLDFVKARKETLEDKHVSWVASVFKGDKIISTAPETIQQLHLPFQAYNFQYIPVETLSSIYEQFIDNRKAKGAIYTPEFLADYLLSEVEWAKPIVRGGKILDPACGSGIFLVLAYRRLIEKEIVRLRQRLTPHDLKEILVESIYGVERERDACYITEFSLILTLLHYVNPPDLDRLEFKFPNLHNTQIFETDFFDLKSEQSDAQFWAKRLNFDWIVGNPPWTSKLNKKEDRFALSWIKLSQHKVSGQRVAEAFSWLVMHLLNPKGIVGLLLPATSLYNLNSKKFRQKFFTEHAVLRFTNFANLRDFLFGKDKKDVLPAATVIYRTALNQEDQPEIIHYGIWGVEQKTSHNNSPWSITINENGIRTISPYLAQTGEFIIWKIALWGTYIDERIIKKIQFLIPETLNDICQKNKLVFHEGSQLRDYQSDSIDELIHVPCIKDKKQFNTNTMKYIPFRFSLPSSILDDIPDEKCYVRKQGGQKGLSVTWAPHIVISPAWQNYIAYSNEDFVISPRQMGIAAQKKSVPHKEDYLKALTVYLNSSLVAYYLFFHSPEWGISRRAKRVSTTEVGRLPTPDFTMEQTRNLAKFYEDIVYYEQDRVSRLVAELKSTQLELNIGETEYNRISHDQAQYNGNPLTPREYKKIKPSLDLLQIQVQRQIDKKIYELLKIPLDTRLIIDEFIQVRLPLDQVTTNKKSVREPTPKELLAYAKELQAELNAFTMEAAYHQVSIAFSNDLVECIVEITNEQSIEEVKPVKVEVTQDSIQTLLFAELSENIREQISQWVYIQRSLYLFDGPHIHLYKAPRLIDWTRTQAIHDAGEIIGRILTESTGY
ncbi:MAG: N-6 DNA methylase [Chloroflexota bacterium]